jgi:hypothetical protein
LVGIGRLCPTLSQKRLQRGAIDQGQLYGLALPQRCGQQLARGGSALVEFVVGSGQCQATLREPDGFVVHAANRLVGRDAGAARQSGHS